ncbi:MAG: formylglycine-generating enzyme family protein [bacterium]|nr:formylglycine-generating enzyme family protein [bacterium]
MRPTLRPLLLALPFAAAVSAATPVLAQATGKAVTPPPGMVEVDGGRTFVGSDVKEITALVTASPSLVSLIRALDAETPQNRLEVPTFFMNVNELTNEQYKPFVEATGHRPPFDWGREAIDAAARAFLEEQGKARLEAQAAGKPIGPRKEFDKEKWWSENWRQSEWKMPEADALRPVTYVDYSDALAYCRWAGLRLPTETEFQRACRADSKNSFPWGEEWDDKRFANTSEMKGRKQTMPVGSFPAGASDYGIFDLSGNVWEWTSSPYVAHTKFKKNKYSFGKGAAKIKKEPEPTWDANQRVAKSGSWQNPRVAARVTARRPCDRTQMTNAMGFRPVASSGLIGVDVARAIFTAEIQNSDARGEGVVYAPNKTVAMHKWEMSESAFDGPPAGYQIITGYEYMAFVPIDQMPDSQDVTFRKMTLVNPVQLGFLSTTEKLVNPDLAPGTYIIAFRAGGKPEVPKAEEDEEKKDEGEGEAEEVQEPEVEDPWAALIDIKKDNLIFLNSTTGEFITAIEAPKMSFAKGTGGGKFSDIEKTEWEKDADGNDVQKIESWMVLECGIQTKIRNRLWPLKFEFMPAPGTTSKSWAR